MSIFLSEPAQAAAKAVFEGLRNALVCAAVAVAGMAIGRFPKLSPLGIDMAPVVMLLMVIFATTLFLWNAVLTFHALWKNSHVPSGATRWISIPAFVICIVLMLTFFGAAVKLQVRQFEPGDVPSDRRTPR